MSEVAVVYHSATGTTKRMAEAVHAGAAGVPGAISSTPSGDKLQTLTALAVTAMQHGMIWVGVDQMPLNPEQLNRLSVYRGAAGQADHTTTPPGVMAPDLRTGEMLGARVARLAARVRASA